MSNADIESALQNLREAYKLARSVGRQILMNLIIDHANILKDNGFDVYKNKFTGRYYIPEWDRVVSSIALGRMYISEITK